MSSVESQRRYRIEKGQQPRAARVFELAPLLDAIAHRGEIGWLAGQMRTAEENRLLGLERGRRRDYDRKHMNAYVADALAVRVGFHPSQIWTHWWADAEVGA